MSKLSVVAIVGRMNVGKSTLFNRLSESVKSITLDYAGVTRDVLRDQATWHDRTFELVDTGGISLDVEEDKILEQVRQKALDLIDEASLVLFMVDGTTGPLAEDEAIAQILRTKNKKVILVLNKSDVKLFEEHRHDFYDFPHEAVVAISAEHGLAMHDLLDAVLELLPASHEVVEEKPAFKVVFLGRPNVGKSSLMNALLNYERSIVSDIPGTTREALSEKITFYQEHLQITDTPGIRRKRVVDETLEQLMVKSAFSALKDASIVVLMLDASEAGIVDQELKLAFYAFEEQNKALIILINKADLATDATDHDLERSFAEYGHLVKKIPMMRISCKTGKNIGKVIPLLKEVWERHSQKLPRDLLSALIYRKLQQTPLMHNRQKLEVHKVKQITSAPIAIALQSNHPEWFDPSALRFFENIVREEFDLVGAPLNFIVRKKI